MWLNCGILLRKNILLSNVLINFVRSTSTKTLLINKICDTVKVGNDKVTIVGCGEVGCATAVSILATGISGDLPIIDIDEKKLEGEMKDFQHGSLYLCNSKVTASPDYAISENSKVCIVTAGVRQKQAESRLDLVQRNTEVLRSIIPQLVKYSPDTIILMVTNPVDVLTYVTWKLSGLPRNRVIGTGTSLDSSRFRYFISQRFGISPSSCDGYIIGEHGESSVAVWSSVTIAGTRIKDINPKFGEDDDPEKSKDMHTQVIKGGGEVIKLKGYTSWAVAAVTAYIVKVILKNELSIIPVSTFVKGHLGFNDDVVLSLPCVIGENGVVGIAQMSLSSSERSALMKSAKTLFQIQNDVKF